MASLISPSRSFPLSRRLSHLDWWMLLTVGLLMGIGLMSLYSIDHAASSDYFKKQLLRIGIGVVPFMIFWLVRPDWLRRWANVLYLVNISLLVLVLVAGRARNEAQRWIEIGPLDFQPSELAKLLIAITVATYFARESAHEPIGLGTFVKSFLHVAIPMALIFKQPHLGSTLVIGVMWLAMSLAAGVRMRYVVGAVILGIAGLTAAYFTPGVLNDYQRERVIGLFNPDPKKSGYQVERGLVAIGSGGLTGKGFLKGEQKSLRFIPEQQTDFIFTVIGEEGGLVGGLIMLTVFGAFLMRIWLIVFQGADAFDRIVAAGLLALFAFHLTANLGMVLRLLPVVGLWLPFISYGGTAIWLCMASVGLLLNLRSRSDVAEF